MQNKILKNIILENFKKSWILIVSFMIFIVIAFSIVFGTFNFVFNFTQPFNGYINNKNQDYVFIRQDLMSFSDNENGVIAKYKNEDKAKILNLSADLMDINSNDPRNEKIVSALIDNNSGEIGWYLDKFDKNDGLFPLIEKFGENMFKKYGTQNFNTAIFNTYFLPNLEKKDKNYESWQIYENRNLDDTNHKKIAYLLTDSKYNQKAFSMSLKDKKMLPLNFHDGQGRAVIYATKDTEERYNYKLGQIITYSLGNSVAKNVTTRSNEYVYGGSLDYLIKVSVPKSSIYPTDAYYFSEFNDNNKNNVLWKISNASEYDLYNKNISNFQEVVMSEFSNFVDNHVGIKMSYDFDNLKNNETLINAFLLLSFFILIVMIVLAFVLSYFLIKEIIGKNLPQLFTLKSLGISNQELSLINSVEVLIITIIPFALSIPISMFVNMNFANMLSAIYNLHIALTDWSWITGLIVIGSFLVLTIGYFLISLILLQKINLTTNQVNLNNTSIFKIQKISDWLFSWNINYGLNYAFTTKNFTKIIVTFLIEFLIILLMSVLIQFSTSINLGRNNYKNNYANYDFRQDLNIQKIFANPSKGINFSGLEEKEGREVTTSNYEELAFKKDLTNYWIKRSTINNIISQNNDILGWLEDLKSLKDKWEKFQDSYDNIVSRFSNTKKIDFEFDFGSTLKQENSEIASSYKFWDKNDHNYNFKAIIIDKNNSMYNKLFPKDYQNTNKNQLNIIISKQTEQQRYIGYNDAFEIWDTNSDNATEMAELPAGNQFLNPIYNSNLLLGDIFIDRDNFISIIKNHVVQKSDSVNLFDAVEKGIDKTETFSNQIPYFFQYIPLRKNPNDHSLLGYLENIASISEGNNAYGFSTTPLMTTIDFQFDKVNPIFLSLIIIFVLAVIIYFLILIFIINIISSENYNTILIMKAIGYSKKSILSKFINGYLFVIVLGAILAEIVTSFILVKLDNVFNIVIGTDIKFYWSWQIIVLFCAILVISISLIYLLIAQKIKSADIKKIDID